jgi:hypothetical protein
VFPLTGKYFPLIGKCFPLTNFLNDKQIQESLESNFPKNEFRETNMAYGRVNILAMDGHYPEENVSPNFI